MFEMQEPLVIALECAKSLGSCRFEVQSTLFVWGERTLNPYILGLLHLLLSIWEEKEEREEEFQMLTWWTGGCVAFGLWIFDERVLLYI